jgi:hypothetical protein
MSARLFAIWKLIRVLYILLNPLREGKERGIYSITSETGRFSLPFPLRGFLRKRKKGRPFLKITMGFHLIKGPFFLFPVDLRPFLLFCLFLPG